MNLYFVIHKRINSIAEEFFIFTQIHNRVNLG